MKKLISLIIIASFLLTGCFDDSNREKIRVFSPGVYIDESIISDFENEYNAKVIFDEFDSNEQMYTKLLSGDSYDVLVPSDYMIDRLIQEDMLLKIDKSKISNFDALIPSLKNPVYDKDNQYSVPYFWGSVGIVYDKNQVDKKDLEKEGWNILKDPKYKGNTFFYDSERDAFMIAAKALGYSMNDNDPLVLEKEYEWLKDMHNTMDTVYVLDTVIEQMSEGSRAMAVMYSGDAAFIMSENEDLDFYMPDQGTNIWTDSMVIFKNSRNPKLAHQWINFMLEEDIALANSEFVGYSSPVQSVYDELQDPDNGLFGGNHAYTPRLDGENDETFIYDEALRKQISELWIRIKAQ